MWWWGIYNKWQATGFLLAALGSWVAYLPTEWIFSALPMISGFGICITNAFQTSSTSAYDRAKMRSQQHPSMFWPGLPVFCAGIAVGSIIRVTQNGVSPMFALAFSGLICGIAVVAAGVAFVFDAFSKRRNNGER